MVEDVKVDYRQRRKYDKISNLRSVAQIDNHFDCSNDQIGIIG